MVFVILMREVIAHVITDKLRAHNRNKKLLYILIMGIDVEEKLLKDNNVLRSGKMIHDVKELIKDK